MNSFSEYYLEDPAFIDNSFFNLSSPNVGDIDVSDNSLSVQSETTRVCDRCISKRVKCNQARPSCSRCSEVDLPCTYSAVKRKPGPAKGSRRKRQLRGVTPSGSARNTRQWTETSSVGAHSSDFHNNEIASSLGQDDINTHVSDIAFDFAAENTNHDGYNNLFTMGRSPYHAAQERSMLEHFFTLIHPSIPLLDSSDFLSQYDLGVVNNKLLVLILMITAALLKQDVDTNHITNHLSGLAKSLSTENSRMPSLDEFQQACLLAFFTFHQCPGQDSWLRIGTLSRKAYRWGLNDIDNPDQRPAIISSCIGEREVEAWRRVWWFIFCLDSYSNLSAGTPVMLEKDSIKTSLLIQRNNLEPASTDSLIFLAESNMLWETVKSAILVGHNINANLHIITTAFIKESATIIRQMSNKFTPSLQARCLALEEDHATIRLSLPPSYLSSNRNVLCDESSTDYHARLICGLHLHLARLYLSLPVIGSTDEERMVRWHTSLEVCLDIVEVAKVWSSSYSLSVDPAICFVFFFALLVLHLHLHFEPLSSEAGREKIRKSITTLKLFLGQFAEYWRMPRMLLVVVDSIAKSIPPSIGLHDVGTILKKLRPPMHQDWDHVAGNIG